MDLTTRQADPKELVEVPWLIIDKQPRRQITDSQEEAQASSMDEEKVIDNAKKRGEQLLERAEVKIQSRWKKA